MTTGEFKDALASQPAVKVSRKDWRRLGKDFAETEAHDTGIAGMLRVGEFMGELVAVEEATPTHLAVRRLGTVRRAKAFVKDRKAAYDRLWDG